MVKAALAVFLALWTPVQAAEPAFDALAHLLHEYAGPVDAAAAQAVEAEAPAGERLAQVSADLALMAEGFELFRAAEHSEAALAHLPDHVVPELRPFFKDRDASLRTIYRTLAVTDYTWASRFPEPPCGPRERRASLLAAGDRLFAGENGELSPWLARLLGPAAVGKSAADALDRASAKSDLSPRDYELLRAKAAKITAALRSEKAAGSERARLYCLRAEVHEALAAAHAVSAAPITASAASGSAADSVVLLAWIADGYAPRAVGAGVMVETAMGPRLLTDERLRAGGQGRLIAIARGKDGGPGPTYPVAIEPASGLVMVGTIPDAPIPALRLASDKAAQGDLVRALGHMRQTGLWTLSQGLVTDARDFSFASDAIIGTDMLGSPLLNASGEVVGLVVLGDGAPVALHLATLRAALARTAPAPVEYAVPAPGGTSSVLTTARPIVGDLHGADGMAIEAGLPSTLGGVNWEGGGGVGNWRPSMSGGRPRSYSGYSSRSSSYSSSDSGGAEIGRALGEALAPLIEALIFRGIPALFRKIGSLFKSKPKSGGSSGSSTVKARAPEKPKEAEKPNPKEPLKVSGIKLTIDRAEALQNETVLLIAELTFTGEEGSKAGHLVDFSRGLPTNAVFLEGPSARSNASGTAFARFVIKHDGKTESFSDLEDEERRMSGEDVVAPLHAEPAPGAKGADAAKGHARRAFSSLSEEAEPEIGDSSDTDSQAVNASVSAGVPTPGVLWSGKIGASAGGLNDDGDFKLLSGRCPSGAAMQAYDPENVAPGEPAKGDMVDSLNEESCREIEFKALHHCAGKNSACLEAKRKELGYLTLGCDILQAAPPTLDFGSSPQWMPKPKRPLKYRCVRPQGKSRGGDGRSGAYFSAPGGAGEGASAKPSFTPDEVGLLRKFFGADMKGALERLKNFLIPDKLSEQTLAKYQRVAESQIERGMDKNGVQKMRLELVRRAITAMRNGK